ncbi:unnamed protein product, partial [Owenia fusiformis]
MMLWKTQYAYGSSPKEKANNDLESQSVGDGEKGPGKISPRKGKHGKTGSDMDIDQTATKLKKIVIEQPSSVGKNTGQFSPPVQVGMTNLIDSCGYQPGAGHPGLAYRRVQQNTTNPLKLKIYRTINEEEQSKNESCVVRLEPDIPEDECPSRSSSESSEGDALDSGVESPHDVTSGSHTPPINVPRRVSAPPKMIPIMRKSDWEPKVASPLTSPGNFTVASSRNPPMPSPRNMPQSAPPYPSHKFPWQLKVDKVSQDPPLLQNGALSEAFPLGVNGSYMFILINFI